MDIKDLKNIHESLGKVISKAQQISKEKFVEDTYNRTDFEKYKTYIKWSIGILRWRISWFSHNCSEKIKLQNELKRFEYVQDTIDIFIEWELQDQMDKIY